MRKLALFGFGLVVLLSLASIVRADEETDSLALVDKAVSFFQEKGKDYALRVMNLPSGPFRKGELYVFAGSMDNLTYLAHPVNPELVGKPQREVKDAKGTPIFQEFVEVAKDPGAGWVQYWWLRRAEKEPTLKRSYVKRIPGENIFVGAGFYVK